MHKFQEHFWLGNRLCLCSLEATPLPSGPRQSQSTLAPGASRSHLIQDDFTLGLFIHKGPPGSYQSHCLLGLHCGSLGNCWAEAYPGTPGAAVGKARGILERRFSQCTRLWCLSLRGGPQLKVSNSDSLLLESCVTQVTPSNISSQPAFGAPDHQASVVLGQTDPPWQV